MVWEVREEKTVKQLYDKFQNVCRCRIPEAFYTAVIEIF